MKIAMREDGTDAAPERASDIERCSEARARTGRGASLAPTRQFAAMVLAPVIASREAELRTLLDATNVQTRDLMRGGARAGDVIVPFHDVLGLHYARLVLLPIAGRTMLALATDFDGPDGEPDADEVSARSEHFEELAELEGLQRVFAHCEGVQPGQLAQYFERHRRAASTSFVAAPGRSVQQIKDERALRRRIDGLLSGDAASGKTPEEVRAYVLRKLAGSVLPAYPEQPDLSARNTVAWLKAGGVVLLTLALIGAALSVPLQSVGMAASLTLLGALALLALVATRLRWLERHDAQFQPEYNAATHAHMEHAATDENRFLQNQLTHVVHIKDGPLRWLLIRGVFWVVQQLASHTYNRGKLGDIPSIHFARWVLGPARSVIFFSNFDSSWQSYLGDFIDKASAGLTAIWSNTKLYPRTTWLLRAGSRDAGRFLAWTRAHQLPTQVWYAAYPGLSVSNIIANTELRRGLAEPERVDAVSWLAHLRNVVHLEVEERYGDDQARANPLALDDIQGIILKGYGHRSDARYLLLRVASEQAADRARQWLAKLPVTSAITGGSDRKAQQPDPLLNVAFTHAGLLALGLEPALCNAFSTPFVQGSTSDDRARINGDVGPDAPCEWEWGAGTKEVHVALLIFADAVEAHLREYREQARQNGLIEVATLDAGTLPGRKEHFGFRDGIAQPTLQGSGDPAPAGSAIAAGEILLGHRDGYGNVAPAPVSARGFRFGFNGSYMVLRQLEQDVEAFWKYCEAQSSRCALPAVQVASKMVGRWPSGAPLVRYPDKDPGGSSDDDAFGYFELSADNDRFGGRCPFGAHVRRTNPRDWGLGKNAAESAQLSNLHRIMRRGRPYGKPFVSSMDAAALIERAQRGPDGERRGLQFVCFNAHLERQFEFVQQQWCKNPKFAGQDSDADPLLGGHPGHDALDLDAPSFTLQSDVQAGASRRLNDVASFVRLRGSAYLFMPSISALRLLPQLKAPATPAREYERVPPDEQLHIDGMIDDIRTMLQARYAGKATLRDAHPKLHGLVRARLEIDAKLPARLHTPLFRPNAHYDAWARFSNEQRTVGSDLARDTRGLALKLVDVHGEKLLDGEESSLEHDFVFLSVTRFVARDVAEFARLVHAMARSMLLVPLASPVAFLRHAASLRAHRSVLDTAYSSVVPALLGTTPVKYHVVPVDPKRWPSGPKGDRDFLRARMKEALRGDKVFAIEVQEYDVERPWRTPIEDASVRWKGEPIRVATLTIPAQDDFDTVERRALGERLAFNPFRCLPEHRPLGGINRARRQVYRAISSFRNSRNGVRKGEVPKP